MVCEFLSEGSLDKLLLLKQKEIITIDLLHMVKHILSGMKYLVEHKIVHRDLALRNLLVAQNLEGKYIVKVGDFGLSRTIAKEYVKDNTDILPVKWSAPELITQGISSSKSDVWSFGVCLWELFSYGTAPYYDMSNQQVVEKIMNGYRMLPPLNCPVEIYSIMLSCWHSKPDKRPTFDELSKQFNQYCFQFAQKPTQIATDIPLVDTKQSIYQ